MTEDTGADAATAIGATMMRAAFERGDYWSGGADRFTPYFAGGAPEAPKPGTAVVPADSPSSLSPQSMEQGRLLESWMGDPKSPYNVGDEHRTAAEYQAYYRALLRGEEAGSAGAVAPEHSDDVDVPGTPSGYRLDGLHIFHAEDRDLVDTFGEGAGAQE